MDYTNSNIKFQIPMLKADGSNWNTYKRCITSYAMRCEALHILTGEPSPSNFATVPPVAPVPVTSESVPNPSPTTPTSGGSTVDGENEPNDTGETTSRTPSRGGRRVTLAQVQHSQEHLHQELLSHLLQSRESSSRRVDSSKTDRIKAHDLYMLIASTLPDSEADGFCDRVPIGDARGLWKSVVEHYEPSTRSSLISQLRAAVNLRQENRNVRQYVGEVNRSLSHIRSACQDRNLDVFELIATMVILLGLSPKYTGLTEQLFLRPNLSLTECIETVIEQTARIDDLESHDIQVAALRVNTSAASNHMNPRCTDPRCTRPWCFSCKRHGHTDATCFKLHPELQAEHMRKAEAKQQFRKNQKAKTVTVVTPSPDSSVVPTGKTFTATSADGSPYPITFVLQEAHTVKLVSCLPASDNDYSSGGGDASAVSHAHRVHTPSSFVAELDSGASLHFVSSAAYLSNVTPCDDQVAVANGRTERATCKGNIPSLDLNGVRVIPSFPQNLLSVSQFVAQGHTVVFSPDVCGAYVVPSSKIKIDVDPADILLRARLEHGSFIVRAPLDIPSAKSAVHDASCDSLTSCQNTPDSSSLANPTSFFMAMLQNYCQALSNSSSNSSSPALPPVAPAPLTTPVVPAAAVAPVVRPTIPAPTLWFLRLGLCSPYRLHTAITKNLLKGIDLPPNTSLKHLQENIPDVTAYHQGRQASQPHRDLHAERTSTAPFQLIHMDLKVVNVNSYTHCRYALIIVDDHSRYITVIALPTKSEIPKALYKFAQQTVGSIGFKINRVRCDNAAEQKSFTFDEVMSLLRANPEYSNAYSSEQNGVAERGIRKIVESGNTLLFHAKLPKKAWAECYQTAAYLENRLPCSSNPDHKTPYEMVFGTPPDVSHLRTIGSICHVFVPKPKRSNSLSSHTIQGILIGYPSNTTGYRILLDATRGIVTETSDVRIIEPANINDIANSPLSPAPGESPSVDITLEDAFPSDVSIQLDPVAIPPLVPPSPTEPQVVPLVLDDAGDANNPQEPPIEHLDQAPVLQPPATVNDDDDLPEDLRSRVDPRLLPENNHSEAGPAHNTRSQIRARAPPALNTRSRVKFSKKVMHRAAVAFLALRCMAVRCLQAKIPFHVAIKDPKLRESMLAEIKDLFKKGAIKIVKRPIDRTPISSTWAHKYKYNSLGEYERAKSRICPRGFEAVPGIDYDPDRVSAATLHIESAMFLLTLQVKRNMYSKLVDANSAFSTTPNSAETYMEAFPGLNLAPDECLLLVNSLNGLPQGAFDWQEKAAGILQELGFKISVVDPCVFYQWKTPEQLIVIGLYVDDFKILADLASDLEWVIKEMQQRMSIKIADDTTWLGMRVIHDRLGRIIRISQPHFISKLLERFNMSDCKPQYIPALPNSKLIKALIQDESVSDFDMIGLIGCLLWLARTSRPDILYAVCQLCRHAQVFDKSHVEAAKRILRYLKATIDLELILHSDEDDDDKDNIEMEVYVDADFAGEPEENAHPMRSLTGMVAYIKGVGPVFSSSSLQDTISRSTAEAEYKATASAAQFCAGFRQLLEELGFKQDSPSTIYNDNNAAIAMTKSKASGSKLRHIKLSYHYVRELVQEKQVTLVYCPSELMIADILTKALPRPQFEVLRALLMGHRRSV